MESTLATLIFHEGMSLTASLCFTSAMLTFIAGDKAMPLYCDYRDNRLASKNYASYLYFL